MRWTWIGGRSAMSVRQRARPAVIEGSHCRLHLPRPRHPSGTAPRLGGTIPLATATLNRPIAGLCSVHGVAEPSCRRARQRRRWARGEARGRSARAPRCRSWRPNAAASGGGQGCREPKVAAPLRGCLDGRARCRTLRRKIDHPSNSSSLLWRAELIHITLSCRFSISSGR